MEGVLPSILCCNCGITIEQNPSNMCISCIRDNVDITAEIAKKMTIHTCRTCKRWLAPPWQTMQLESKELMAMCLRKIQGLSKVKLIDAVWIWTEPHSLRLKIKLTVQKEVINGAILQQTVVVEYIIRNQQCKACQASFAQGHWHAIVQVRQRVPHKRTFFYLEQLILKHESHMECIKIESFRDGMDFYFVNKNQALRFIEFLNGNVPTKVKYARKLVSANHSENTANFKHNFVVEIAPICKDDLLIIPKELARGLSNISRLVLVKRIGAGIHIIDPLNAERSEINTDKYWRYGFKSVMNSKQLARYIVLSVEPILSVVRPSAKIGKQRNPKARGRSSSVESSVQGSVGESSQARSYMLHDINHKVRLAEVIVAREKDFGVNDQQYSCITHLGNILREGDVVFGYDFTNTNWNVDEEDNEDNVLDKHSSFPDLVLVRKCYDTTKSRNWSLRKLTKDNGSDHNDQDDDEYEAFMQEIEGDREYRSRINLYKKDGSSSSTSKGGNDGEGGGRKGDNGSSRNRKGDKMNNGDDDDTVDHHEAVSVNMNGMDDEEVRLDELLDDMSLGDGGDDDGDGDYNDEEDQGVGHNHDNGDDNDDDL